MHAGASVASRRDPVVSVVMPVYNGGAYVREAIESILNQTLTDFEFIIINDGSTDDTEAVIRSCQDARIRLITQSNHGLVYSLNRGIDLAKGVYIARMDGDDISARERLELQVSLLESRPRISVVGTAITRMDHRGRPIGTEYYLANDPELRQDLLTRCPFAHGSVVMRRHWVKKVGGYREEFWPAEDYDLWRRLALVGELANIVKPLYFYRESVNGVTETKKAEMIRMANRISEELVKTTRHVDIPIRRCMALYKRTPDPARSELIKRLLEGHFELSVAYARQRRLLLAFYRIVKLAISPSDFYNLVANKVVKKLRPAAGRIK